MEQNMLIDEMDMMLQKDLRKFYANEKLGYEVYKRLADDSRLTSENSDLLRKIADHEKRHVEILEKYLGKVIPNEFHIERVLLRSRILGFTFTLKRMEIIQSKIITPEVREKLVGYIPELKEIFVEEDMIDKELLTLLDEKRLVYVSSMVLGLNDALVELSGAIAGFTFAMRNNRIIAMAGIITGISASLSMAASEYLSTRADGIKSKKTPLKAAMITGTAYVITVTLMVLPYLILPKEDYIYALSMMLVVVISIIALFSYYVSVTKGEKFKDHFRIMAIVSLSVAFASFVIGVIVKNVLNIEI
ncbi:VIT1/CCC1 transporter family protein [Proteiniclasticum sp.]|uniref:VIT1/CCC1 transporter family protein n=1 Tax=Proteiniclasticum sp. TaxID=2053595 RepID=UPI00289C0E51|nr:VIT1/CCC1 transporter family protein [Proteiniclasticum sp.]